MMSKSLFSKGFKPVKEKINKGSKYIASCYNCAYFYQTEEDDEEVCQNNNVLQYDMVVTPTNISCCHWKYVLKKEESDNGFKKKKLKKPRK